MAHSDRGGIQPRVLQLFEVSSGRRVWRRVLTAFAETLRFSPAGEHLFAGCKDGSVSLFSPPTNPTPTHPGSTQREVLRTAHPGPVRDGQFSSDGQTLVTLSETHPVGGRSVEVRFWVAPSWREVPGRRIVGADLPGRSLRRSPDDRFLLLANKTTLELRRFDVRR